MTNMQDKHTQPGLFRLLVAVIVGTLLPVFVLPWLGMAISGAWRAGLTYFLPVMVQVSCLDICLACCAGGEGADWRRVAWVCMVGGWAWVWCYRTVGWGRGVG